MRLLNVDTLQLESFLTEKTRPPYAILSHTWLPDAEEVGFEDLLRYHEAGEKGELSKAHSIASRAGFKKIQGCCEMAKQSDNLQWAWIDTCCIDKRSSSELSEAINSMFKWYRDAKRCYVLLQDVTGSENDSSFRDSRWFTRAWTLQELIAPKLLSFYDREWHLIGTIHDDRLEIMDDDSQLCDVVSSITSIPIAFLKGAPLTDACVAKRMSWASKRESTRSEDVAYSLLGIFDVNMPLLYGEGHKAFIRLQEEIINHIHDDSILAWGAINPGAIADRASIEDNANTERVGALATSPADFRDCGDFAKTSGILYSHDNLDFQVTPAGIKVGVNLYCSSSYYSFCELSCFTWRYPSRPIMILLGHGPLATDYLFNFAAPYSQWVRKGRSLWCGRVTPRPRPFLVLPPFLATPLKFVLGGDNFWYRHPSYTITLAKDNTPRPISGTMRSIKSKLQSSNHQQSQSHLILLNLPDDHIYNIEYCSSPGFEVLRNTLQPGQHSLQILYSDESPLSRPLLFAIAIISIISIIIIVSVAILCVILFGEKYWAILSSIAAIPFIVSIVPYWSIADEVTPSLLRRIRLFMHGKGVGLRVNQRAIRACIRIMEQRPRRHSSDANQVMVIICYRPSLKYGAAALDAKLTCYLATESMRQCSEEGYSINPDEWPRVYKNLTIGENTYIQRTQQSWGGKVIFTVEVESK
ncbi:heterokaryon incompatibility protein-domain-containing protein [Nemania serpens]|nr:heterokaryon incompatibility protein-domain-containing protein [Nemania serpens]